jgi:hypothetical protein
MSCFANMISGVWYRSIFSGFPLRVLVTFSIDLKTAKNVVLLPNELIYKIWVIFALFETLKAKFVRKRPKIVIKFFYEYFLGGYYASEPVPARKSHQVDKNQCILQCIAMRQRKSIRLTRRSSVVYSMYVYILSEGGGAVLRRLGCTQSTQASQSHIVVPHVSISAFFYI